ncbi:hypothetical protein HGRIS_010966 [Hohenbuehelia grisea]|uniref:Uncharacterized protein n=1 Tax=Hohenbuehelia grisea TaxID=104357 RepID=A0ABR3IYP2_9AGAR
MPPHQVPWDQLNANTMRAVVRDLGGVGYSTRTQMLSFLESIQEIGHERTVKDMSQAPKATPPQPKPAAVASSSKAGRVSARKRKSLDSAIEDGFPYGTRNRGKRSKVYHQPVQRRSRDAPAKKRRASEPVAKNSRRITVFDGVEVPPAKGASKGKAPDAEDPVGSGSGEGADGDSNKENDASPAGYLLDILTAAIPGAEAEDETESVHGLEFSTAITIQVAPNGIPHPEQAVASNDAGPSNFSA